MGLYRNVQPHECQLSAVAVKEQASLVVQKNTTEIGSEEMRGQNVRETRMTIGDERGVCGRWRATGVSMTMAGKNTGTCMTLCSCKGLTLPPSTTTCLSLRTSCHLMPNPFIHCSVFTNHCLSSFQAVVKRWFKSSPCIESTHSQYNRGHCKWVRSC